MMCQDPILGQVFKGSGNLKSSKEVHPWTHSQSTAYYLLFQNFSSSSYSNCSPISSIKSNAIFLISSLESFKAVNMYGNSLPS